MHTDKTLARVGARLTVDLLARTVAPARLAQSPATWGPGNQIRVTTLDGHKVLGSLQSATDEAS
jgi:hypothetical protein